VRIKYVHDSLDRAATRRGDSEWIESAIVHEQGQLIAVWRDRNPIDLSHQAQPRALRHPLELCEHASELVFLGLEGDWPLFAADYSHLEAEAVQRLFDTEFADLRRHGPLLDDRDAALLAYARGMLYWHRNHRFCGRCGSPTLSQKSGHSRKCSNPRCGHANFPRTDPAIIVLVEHPRDDGGPPRCLLGRTPKFPPGVYSTLAGFVEPGESLEQTVRREVFEESGIRVGSVRYLASQPWPFPSSLMLGFHATAISSEIHRHDEELEDARWFGLDELRQAGEWGERAGLCLPRRDSIARFLIQTWIDAQSP
jgi:NAD+ diphosphatase